MPVVVAEGAVADVVVVVVVAVVVGTEYYANCCIPVVRGSGAD